MRHRTCIWDPTHMDATPDVTVLPRARGGTSVKARASPWTLFFFSLCLFGMCRYDVVPLGIGCLASCLAPIWQCGPLVKCCYTELEERQAETRSGNTTPRRAPNATWTKRRHVAVSARQVVSSHQKSKGPPTTRTCNVALPDDRSQYDITVKLFCPCLGFFAPSRSGPRVSPR